MPKLNDVQKTALRGTMLSVSRATTAAVTAASGDVREPAGAPTPGASPAPRPAPSMAPSTPPATALTSDWQGRAPYAVQWISQADRVRSQWAVTTPSSLNLIQRGDAAMGELRSRLIRAHGDHLCDFTTVAPDFGFEGATTILRMEKALRVSGVHCPISLDLSTSMNGSAGNYNGRFMSHYSVSDAELAKLNDVTAFDYDGSLAIGSDGNSGSVDIHMSGNVRSAQYGNIQLKVTGAGSGLSHSGAKVEVDFLVQFQEFEAQLRETIDGSDVNFEVNGERVSESEFRSYFIDTAGAHSLTF